MATRVDPENTGGYSVSHLTSEEMRIERSKDLIFEDRLVGTHVTTHLKSIVFPRKNQTTTHFAVFRFSFENALCTDHRAAMHFKLRWL